MKELDMVIWLSFGSTCARNRCEQKFLVLNPEI